MSYYPSNEQTRQAVGEGVFRQEIAQFGVPAGVADAFVKALKDAGHLTDVAVGQHAAFWAGEAWKAAIGEARRQGAEPTPDLMRAILGKVIPEIVEQAAVYRQTRHEKARAVYRALGIGIVTVLLGAAAGGAAAAIAAGGKAVASAVQAGTEAEMQARYDALAPKIGTILDRSSGEQDFYQRLEAEAAGAAAYWQGQPGFVDSVRDFLRLKAAAQGQAGLAGYILQRGRRRRPARGLGGYIFQKGRR